MLNLYFIRMNRYSLILVNVQLDAQFFFSCMFIRNLCMFRAVMCSSSGELIVSVRYLVYVTLCRWPSGMQLWVEPKTAYQTVTNIQWHIPDVVLIQLILSMMRTWVLETCRYLEKTYTKKELCVKLDIYKNYTEMHGQQNIKYSKGSNFFLKTSPSVPWNIT